VPSDVVDGNAGRREARFREGAHGDGHGLIVAVLGVEDGRPADRAKPEYEPGALIAHANVFGCGAGHREGSREAGQSCKDTSRSALAGEAVADADAERFTLNFNAQLAAGTGGRSTTH
jgi:hypothetical protein